MSPFERPASRASTPLDCDKPLPPIRTALDEPWDGRKHAGILQTHHVLSGSYDESVRSLRNDAPNAPIQGPRKPNMSLFSLFNRPKVQKSRGYAESGLATPAPGNDTDATRMQTNDNVHPANPEMPRSTSSMSFRSHRNHNPGNNNSRRPASRRTSQDHRILAYDAPPLFQAFARSSKNGLVEVSTASLETLTTKSKSTRFGALQLPTERTPRGSTDTSRSGEMLRFGRFNHRPTGSGHVTQAELERKILVLVTTGHLLQYAEYGPSGRLPEKVLALGPRSVAFASDLIGGRPYVAQVVQEVDGDGVAVTQAGSLFSKVGIKKSAEKSMVSNTLIVLPDGEELNAWLGAIRKQIELVGGEAIAAEQTEDHDEDLTFMQRYHIRRASRSSEAATTQIHDTVVSPIEPIESMEPMRHTRTMSNNSIEEAEAFGDILAAGASYSRPTSTRGRSTSDALSMNSSIAPSVDHLRLNSLRSSVRMSTITNVTGWTSRTNSMTSESATNKHSMDSPIDSYSSRGPYRNLSSYGNGKRSRTTPSMQRGSTELTVQTTLSSPKLSDAGVDSPVMGWNSSNITALPQIVPQGRTLNSRQSMPSLVESKREKHDSKIEPPPSISEAGERPTSFVGDLPSLSTWTSKISTSKRTSKIQPLSSDKQMHRMSSAPALRSAAVASGQREPVRRKTSQPFTLPLKINPSGSASWHNSRQMQNRENRSSPVSSEPETPLPRITTLEAQVSTTHEENAPSNDQQRPTQPRPTDNNIPHNPPAPTNTRPPTSQGQRLSIFPSTQPTPTAPIPNRSVVRPPSLSIMPTYQHQPPSTKRPYSIQIRTTALNASNNTSAHPSPLPSMSAGPTMMTTSNNNNNRTTRSFTPPIRSLKPSRSSAILTNNHNNTTTNKIPANPRTSLPALDLGIPVVGLGPPAPPPSAPLPNLPPAAPSAGGRYSRAPSPLPMMMREGEGLGIRVE